MTHYRGFLGLAKYNSASVGEGPPPLSSWTKDEVLERNIRRVFPLTETFEASPATVGAEMVTILLGDLLKAPKDFIPIDDMKNKREGMNVIGAMTMEGLVEQLANKQSFHYPMTFGRAREMVTKAGFDVPECLLMGMFELQLTFFPAIKFTDLKNTKRVTWKPNHYVELHRDGSAPSTAAQAASLTGDKEEGPCLAKDHGALQRPWDAMG